MKLSSLSSMLTVSLNLTGDAIVCQPMNRAVRGNLSYSQTEAKYDKTYCSLFMRDYSDNMITVSENEPNGINVVGIKGEGRFMYQKFFPFALIIQATLCCVPTLLWKTLASEELRASLSYIRDISNNATPPKTGVSPSAERRSEAHHNGRILEELRIQVDLWESGKFLTRAYAAKIMLTIGILVFIICFYLACSTLNYFSLRGLFICHVHKQSLVTCAFADIDLIRLVWIVNIVLVDIATVIVVFQLLNVAIRMPRKRTFFSCYFGIGDRKTSKLVNDADLISHFCRENLSVMCPGIICGSYRNQTALYSPLISLGSSEEDLNSTGSSLSYSTAPQYVRRQSDGRSKES